MTSYVTEVISVAETSCLIAPAHTKHRKAVTAAMSCNSGVQALRPILRLFSPSFLLLFFSFGIELWVFGVSERFFFSCFFFLLFFDSIAAQDQHTQLHSRNKEKDKCRSISTVCKTSFRWNASRMSRQPASAFVLFLFLSSLFHLSFFLIFFSLANHSSLVSLMTKATSLSFFVCFATTFSFSFALSPSVFGVFVKCSSASEKPCKRLSDCADRVCVHCAAQWSESG